METLDVFDRNKTFSSNAPKPTGSGLVISGEVAHIVSLVNVVILCTFLSLFGIVSNVLNIIVFVQQGFQETVNISLCALAVSDFVSQLTLLWITVAYNPLLAHADVPFLSMEVEIPTGGIPHIIAINATCWLTAFITFERCICVVFPLKVKDILTPARAKVIVVSISALVVLLQIPDMCTMKLSWKFVPSRNRTMLGVEFLKDSKLIRDLSTYIANVFGPFTSFMLVIFFTFTLVVKLNEKSKWRQQNAKASESVGTSSSSASSSASKDRKAVKMVVAVAVIFIVSFIPSVMMFMLMNTNPDFGIGRKLHYNFIVAMDFTLLAEGINGSVNIIVYYKMSSKYRLVFRSLFLGKKTESDGLKSTT